MRILSSLLLALLLGVSLAAQCQSGAVLCPSGTCHYPIYIQGCLNYASSASCAQCQYNYVKEGPLCVYSPRPDQKDCCIEYSRKTGQCSKCAKSLFLDQNGLCRDLKIVGCLEKNQKGYGCANCAKEFILNNGKCYKKLNYCSEYSSDGSCYSCADGSELLNGLCIRQPKILDCQYPFTSKEKGDCWVEGCAQTYQFGCKRCGNGYALLSDNSCRKGVIVGCSRYNSKGACVDCLKPLYSIRDGYCLPIGCVGVNSKGLCDKCDGGHGYQLVREGYCGIRNCLISDDNGCKVCQKGYQQSEKGCLIIQDRVVCRVCPKFFRLGSDNQCVPEQKGCLEYLNEKCSKCQDNLYLSTDYQCLPKQPGCIYDKGICSSCNAPFSIKVHNGRCQIQGCQSYSIDGCKQCSSRFLLTTQKTCTLPNCLQIKDSKCQKCQQNFQVGEDGNCYKADANCQTYDIQYNCIQCVKGFYMSNGKKCEKERFGCNYVDGRCVSCRAPFMFNPQSQSCEIDGCVDYFLGGCKECGTGYDLRYNSCKLPHCLISVKGNCKECDPDYIMRSDGLCMNKDQFCQIYSKDGFCVECSPKYYLSSINKKCLKKEPGCIYNLKDECFKCQKPFYFDGVRCEIDGCLTLDYDGCKECFYPMIVNNEKLCAVQNCDRTEKGKCIICKPGYALTEDNACRVEDSKCLVYSKKGVGCEKCTKGYRVDQNGKCQYADQHCWDFTKEGNCINCDRLYFLDQFKKCQIRDTNCKAYANGYCQQCRDYYYTHRGLCFPNAKGCLVQKNIKECNKCEDGYQMENNKCTPQITKLSWNSVDMDDQFFGGETDKQKEQAQMIFTLGKDNKKNLLPAISKGGKQFFSKSDSKQTSCQVDSQGEGWLIKKESEAIDQFAGVAIPGLQTFYAVDIKSLPGNSLKRIAIQYTEDGKNWKKIREFDLIFLIEQSVETIYFPPVYAVGMRIRVKSGAPSIKFQFYFNAEMISQSASSKSSTYISDQTIKSVQERMASQQINIFAPQNECVDKQLCWMGLQLCEAKEIYGFGLVPSKDNSGTINEVYLDYSVDGVKFQCYNDCKPIKLNQNKFKLTNILIGSKFRVHILKWQGKPSFGVKFDYQHY